MPGKIGSSPPIVADKNAAQTFTEPNVSLSHTKTTVSGESIGFAESTTATRSDDESSSKYSGGEEGIRIEIKAEVETITPTLSSQTSGVDTISLYPRDANLTTQTISLGGTFSNGPYPAGTYDVVAEPQYSDSSWTVGTTSYQPEFPFVSGLVDITSGADSSSTDPNYARAIKSVAVGGASPTSGTVIVEWPMPTDIFEWDVASMLVSEDGETVSVHIEEYDGEWTTIAGPISRGDSIPASGANNVRFRVELSRSDTAADPALEAIYRRFKL